jgi:hypothetical protein
MAPALHVCVPLAKAGLKAKVGFNRLGKLKLLLDPLVDYSF